jgi:hypothetical protein
VCEAYIIQGRIRNEQTEVEVLKRRDHQKPGGIDGRIILKMTLINKV